MRQDGPLAEPAGPVVHVDVVDRLREEPCDLGDLAAVLGHVGLPVRTGGAGECRRFAEQVGGARDREAWRERVAQPAVVAQVPARAEVGGFAQGPIEDRRRVDGLVVRDPVHHHLADHRADAMRLGSPERGLKAGLVHRAVDERRGGAGGREGPPGGRCHDVGPASSNPRSSGKM